MQKQKKKKLKVLLNIKILTLWAKFSFPIKDKLFN